MIVGRDISHKIGIKRDLLQAQARSVTNQIIKLERELNAVVQEQSQLLKKLAGIYLKDKKIELPKNIDNLLKARDQRIQDANDTISDNEKLLVKLIERRDVLSKTFETEHRVLEAVSEGIEQLYQKDENVLRMRGELQALNETLDQLDAKLERASAEFNEKKIAYEKDKFFMYLIKNGYGTERYNAFGLTARGDAWLANLIHFNRKKQDYETLQAIPSWIKQRIAKLIETRTHTLSELENTYKEIQENLPPIRKWLSHLELDDSYLDTMDVSVIELSRRVQISEEKLKETDSEIMLLRNNIRQASEYISEAADATDQDLFHITKTFANQIAKIGINDLKALADKTETIEDNLIVDQISSLDERYKSLQSQIQHLTPGKIEFTKRLNELEQIERKLKNKGWSFSSGRFDDRINDKLIDDIGVCRNS